MCVASYILSKNNKLKVKSIGGELKFKNHIDGILMSGPTNYIYKVILMNKKLDPKDVEIFLLENLNFFESRESLVGELNFKHSSSSASSILERQVKKLREGIKNLWTFCHPL